MKRSVAALLVLLGGASYGLLGTFVNFGYGEGYTVGEMTGSQMFFGALFLWVVALFNRRTWKKMRIKTVLLLVSAGSLNGLTGVLYYSSMQTVPASIAIVLLFQFAWVGMLYAWLFDGLKPTKPMLVSLVLILVGTFFAADVFTGGFRRPFAVGRVVRLFVGFYVCRLYLRERETGDGSHTLVAEPADGIGGSPRHFCAVSPFVFHLRGTGRRVVEIYLPPRVIRCCRSDGLFYDGSPQAEKRSGYHLELHRIAGGRRHGVSRVEGDRSLLAVVRCSLDTVRHCLRRVARKKGRKHGTSVEITT